VNNIAKDEDILNWCGHRNSERVKALKEFPSAVCPACLLERIQELEDALTKIHNWTKAYPIEVFPEPDFKKAAEVKY